MKRTRWFAPYAPDKTGELRPTMPDAWNSRQAGVYIIRNATGEIVYVGYSGGQLKKTIYRHFQAWPDKSQYRVWYDKTGFEVRFIICTESQASRLEKHFIRSYKPRDNKVTNRSWWEEMTDPKEQSIKALANKAHMCPHLKKDDYFRDHWDESEPTTSTTNATDEEAPF